jgi:toluene monooxygenase electron transfer component
MCQTLPDGPCALEVSGPIKPAVAEAGAPDHLAAVIARRKLLTHDVAVLDLDLERPVDFAAGQFMVMTIAGIPGGRAYSMVNYEPRTRRLVFLVKSKPGGRFSEWFFGDRVEGAAVRLFGPLGHATFHPDVPRDVLCIAGGSGIAGMMAILARACGAGHFDAHRGYVFFGVRSPRDVFFLDELLAFKRISPDRLHVTVALSDTDVDPALAETHPHLAFARGMVHAVAGEHMKGKFENVRAYAAGPPPMVNATLRMLLLEGKLKSADIRYDKFS